MSTEGVLRLLLTETEAPLAAAEMELYKVQERIRELQAERYGLQLALARLQERSAAAAEPEGPPASAEGETPPAAGPETFWPLLSRAEAVERVLESSDGPMTRQDVLIALERSGREGDTADAVSASLAYLRRIDRAARAGRNQWVYVPDRLEA